MKNQFTYMLVTLALLSICTSCKKLTTVDAPTTSLSAGNVFDNNATAAAVLTGIYTNLAIEDQQVGASLPTMYYYPELSADELTLYNLNDATAFAYYTNSLTPYSTAFWGNIYGFIFTANSAIDGLNSSTGLTPEVKQQLLGEAKFIRAFCYFYLVNCYGDVPLVTSSDYKTNSSLARMPVAQVYQQMVTDLRSAVSNLSPNYLEADAMTAYPTGQAIRVRPTRMAAEALLARTLLYMGDYTGADSMASAVISNSDFSLDVPNKVFLMNSSETIWALQPVGTGLMANTGEGETFVLPPTGPSSGQNEVYLSNSLLDAFEQGDLRRSDWVDSVIVTGTTYYYAYKYKIGRQSVPTGEYDIVFRLGEQYLIRAEARAQEGDFSASEADVNVIRGRAGLPTTTANSLSGLLAAIAHERQVELFTEWGHRWFDLKRMGNFAAVMSVAVPQKGGTYSASDSLYPIPASEINLDKNLSQNQGY